jgi:uncharacterized spore protein YtfJ
MTESRSFTPDLGRLTDAADDSFTVRRAYGEPYEHAGTLVIPVAKVWGGIGTGSGGGAGTGSGNGTGHGTGSGKGSGQLGGWSRSFRFGSPEAGGEGDAGTPDHGDASGDASGEARGELHGEGAGEGGGGGGGYGVRVKPVGVYVVSAEGTRWQPVLDLNKAILGAQVVGAVAVLALGWAIGRRR